MEILRNLLFPTQCIYCDYPGEALCQPCVWQLKPFLAGTFTGVTTCVAASEYTDRMRDVVLAYKSGRRGYGPGIATALLRTINTFQISADAVVAIPSTKNKIQERGFDTIGELATQVARQLHLPHLRALALTKAVKDQVGLHPDARRRNLDGAFTPTQRSAKRLLLLDDVVTTGATVTAAAKALRISGAKEIFVVCACRTVGRFTV